MRPLAAALVIFSGFAVASGLFIGGMGVATYTLAVESKHEPGPSVDVADLWTSEPRKVDPTKQKLERVPAAFVIADERSTSEPEATSPSIDPVTTASTQDHPEEEHDQQARLAAAHVAWCYSRYRSYDEVEDSYTSYSGERRPCISPLTKAAGPMLAGEGDPELAESVSLAEDLAGFHGLDAAVVQYASSAAETDFLTEEHIRECFNRYRSYRPEDNSYQPYGGGPRRQCN